MGSRTLLESAEPIMDRPLSTFVMGGLVPLCADRHAAVALQGQGLDLRDARGRPRGGDDVRPPRRRRHRADRCAGRPLSAALVATYPLRARRPLEPSTWGARTRPNTVRPVSIPESSSRLDPMIGTLVNDRYRIQELIASGGMGRVYTGDPGDPRSRRRREGGAERRRRHRRGPDVLPAAPPARGRDPREATSPEHRDAARLRRGRWSVPTAGRSWRWSSSRDARFSNASTSTGGLRRSTSCGSPSRSSAACASRTDAASSTAISSPSNIILVRDDEGEETVKLVDFGIGKMTDRGSAHPLTPDRRGHGDGRLHRARAAPQQDLARERSLRARRRALRGPHGPASRSLPSRPSRSTGSSRRRRAFATSCRSSRYRRVSSRSSRPCSHACRGAADGVGCLASARGVQGARGRDHGAALRESICRWWPRRPRWTRSPALRSRVWPAAMIAIVAYAIVLTVLFSRSSSPVNRPLEITSPAVAVSEPVAAPASAKVMVVAKPRGNADAVVTAERTPAPPPRTCQRGHEDRRDGSLLRRTLRPSRRRRCSRRFRPTSSASGAPTHEASRAQARRDFRKGRRQSKGRSVSSRFRSVRLSTLAIRQGAEDSSHPQRRREREPQRLRGRRGRRLSSPTRCLVVSG